MIQIITVFGLLFATFACYLAGMISGFNSALFLIILGVLLLGQSVLAIIKKAWGVLSVALVGFGILMLWQLAGGIHRVVSTLAKKDAVLSHLSFVTSGFSFLMSLLPFLILVLILALVVKSREVNLKELLFTVEQKTYNEPSLIKHPRLRICKDPKTGKDVYINGEDRYLHCMIAGPTGGGKTALSLQPYVFQDIEFIAEGNQARVIVMEPDGEFSETLAEYCDELNVPYVRLDLTNPLDIHWNPFEGENYTDVAETVTTVLKNTVVKDQFFSNVETAAARNVTFLLKLLHGNAFDMNDFANVLRSVDKLIEHSNGLSKRMRDLPEEQRYIAQNVIHYIKSETLTDQKKEQYLKVCMGLRQKIENLLGNPNIRRVLSGASTFRIEDYYDTPGVLLINTGNDEAGDFFGKFFLLSHQAATLRRPGKASTRTPVATFIDEFPRYATERFVSAFTQGRKYRDSFTIAFQSFSQLELPNSPSYKRTLKTCVRNKIILSGLEYEDAKEAELMMGTEEVTQTSVSYSEGGLFVSRDGERTSETTREKPRYSANYLMFMPWNEIVYKIVQNKQTMIPAVGRVDYAKRKTLAQIQRSSKPLKVKPEKPKINKRSMEEEWQRAMSKLKPKKKEKVIKTSQGYTVDHTSDYSLEEDIDRYL